MVEALREAGGRRDKHAARAGQAAAQVSGTVQDAFFGEQKLPSVHRVPGIEGHWCVRPLENHEAADQVGGEDPATDRDIPDDSDWVGGQVRPADMGKTRRCHGHEAERADQAAANEHLPPAARVPQHRRARR
jgi:hypothetical protein